MKNDNVYYINIHPYVYDLPYQEMIDRYIDAGFVDIQDHDNFNKFVINYVKRYNHTIVTKDQDEYAVEEILTKQILHHMQIFFNKNMGNSITRKSKKYNNITLKNRI
jgi:ribosomal protein S4E